MQIVKPLTVEELQSEAVVSLIHTLKDKWADSTITFDGGDVFLLGDEDKITSIKEELPEDVLDFLKTLSNGKTIQINIEGDSYAINRFYSAKPAAVQGCSAEFVAALGHKQRDL